MVTNSVATFHSQAEQPVPHVEAKEISGLHHMLKANQDTSWQVRQNNGLMGHRIVMRKKRNYHKCPECRCKHNDGLFPKRKGEPNMTCDKCFAKITLSVLSYVWFLGPRADGWDYELLYTE